MEQILQEYVARRPIYVAMADRLQGLLRDLLGSHELDVIQIESRAKQPSSLESKITRKADVEENELLDFTDLCGVRVITYYTSDVDEVEAILREEFEIDEENSVDKARQMDQNQFGYISRHFIVELKDPRKSLPEWKPYKAMKAEIQVRTALQHAWAAVSHKLEYKNEKSVPSELRRSLSSLSALFEIADEKFGSIRNAAVELTQGYEDRVDQGVLTSELNLDSLGAYLRQNDQIPKISDLLLSAGMRIRNSSDKTSRALTDREDLLKFLQALKLSTLREVDDEFSNLLSQPKLLTELCTALEPDARELYLDDLLSQILAVVHEELDDMWNSTYAQPGMSAQIRDRLKDLDLL